MPTKLFVKIDSSDTETSALNACRQVLAQCELTPEAQMRVLQYLLNRATNEHYASHGFGQLGGAALGQLSKRPSPAASAND